MYTNLQKILDPASYETAFVDWSVGRTVYEMKRAAYCAPLLRFVFGYVVQQVAYDKSTTDRSNVSPGILTRRNIG